MERKQAVEEINKLIGKDLRVLADQFRVTVWNGERKNKGWAGHVVERYLGLPLNSSSSPNFGSWELKTIPLCLRAGSLAVKETMAITMIDPYEIEARPFEESHLFRKMRKAVIVARVFESQQETRSLVHSVSEFDLDDPDLYSIVKKDYDLVRECIANRGFGCLTGAMGTLIQPRTKGAGHGTTTRAFYARVPFVAHIVGLAVHPLLSDG